MILLLLLFPLAIGSILFIRECYGMTETYNAIYDQEKEFHHWHNIENYKKDGKQMESPQNCGKNL